MKTAAPIGPPPTGPDGPTTEYLARLEAALELLGPEEAADTAAEIGTHLAQAQAEGTIDSFMSALGSPEALAVGILLERGLLTASGPPALVRGWRTALATGVDVVVTIAPFAVVVPILLLPLGTAAYNGGMTVIAMILLLIAALLTAACVWWAVHFWRSRSRAGRAPSIGMTLADLRVVRAGGETEIVPVSRLRGPRNAGPSRAGAVLRFMVALLVVVGVPYSIAHSYALNTARSPAYQASTVARDAGGAAGAVSAVTLAVTEAVAAGQQDADPPADLLQGRAMDDFADLQRTAYANDARGYQIVWVSSATYDRPEEPDSSNATFAVDVLESGTLQRQLTFTVDKHVDVSADGASGVTWFAVSAIETGEVFDPNP